MSFCEEHTEVRPGPLFFFDQPERRPREWRSNIFHHRERTQSRSEEDEEVGKGEKCGVFKADTSHPMDAYRQAAPQLLKHLDLLLGQHQWADRQCIPHGITNILNHTWEDLAAGAAPQRRPRGTDTQRRSKECPCPGEGSAKPEHEGTAAGSHVGRNGGKTAPETERHKKNSNRDEVVVHRGTTRPLLMGHSVDVLHYSKSDHLTLAQPCSPFAAAAPCGLCPGWIIESVQPWLCFDKSQQISVCLWVLQRLQAAKNSGTLQKAEQDMSTPLILRHYGDTRAERRNRGSKAQSATIINGIPQIPAVKPQKEGRHKLHYRINDGSSFLYYPSGCIAVCQSRSSPPCGGFYTNIFSDSTFPFILGTITAFGHGSVTHPVSGSIKAVWDRGGGLIYGHCGNVTKVWSWHGKQTHGITIQVSDLIIVRLYSGASARLVFRCGTETVQLTLSFLSHFNQSEEMQKDKTFTLRSDAQLRKKRVSLIVREGPDGSLAQWRRGQCADLELRRLQRKARGLAEGWLDYYRTAIGIKCPDMKQMRGGQLRPGLRLEVRAAAGLPSLNPPEQTEAKGLQPTGGDADSPQPWRQPSAAPASSLKLIRASIRPSPPSTCWQPEAPIAPSFPLTLCPVLLRAALLGEVQQCGRRRRCCCSAAVMPALTDLEYDAFVAGQPPHSQQMLVVCVTPPQPPVNVPPVWSQDALGEIYRKRNKDRSTPCTQGQSDSFRLVRYEMWTEGPDWGPCNTLLQHRHNAAPGMVLMYIRGKLLFVGYTEGGSAQDLQRLIIKTRREYRSGLGLPPDYKLSNCMKRTTDEHGAPTLMKREDVTTWTASEENVCH